MTAPIIKAEIREKTGHSSGKVLRKEGLIPAVVYGHRDEAKNIKIKLSDIRNVISKNGTKAQFNIDLDGVAQAVFIKSLQRNVVTKEIINADFQCLYEDEAIAMEIPLSFVNATRDQDAIIQYEKEYLNIEALPKDMPQSIEIDLDGLVIGDSFKVKDLNLDENVNVLHDDEDIIAAIRQAKELDLESDAEVEEEAIEEVEPEVIGEEEAPEETEEESDEE